jgi:membrane-associated protease RseP (regulator of RpoE activity)
VLIEIIGIALFVLLIVASIGLHEIGHLVPAKAFGVKVTEYMIGFGPTLWSRLRGETRYGLKAIPVGGYIRMVGMLPPPPGAPPSTARAATTGRFATLIEDARRQSLEDIAPGDERRVFYRLPPWKRIIIMAGGPFMNLVLAFILFAGVLVGLGLPEPTLRIGAVVPCTPTASAPSGQAGPGGGCPTGSPPSPAAAAGITPGSTVIAINGDVVSDWSAATAAIRALPAGPATLTLRDPAGVVRDTVVDVVLIDRPVIDDRGRPTGQTERTGYLGLRPESEFVPQSFASVPVAMWDLTVRSAEALVSLPVRLYELVTQTLIGGGERDIDGPVSVVGVSRLGGEILASDQEARAKAATFLGLAASLNLFLFLFNLLPVLPLDGGHVAGAVYESIRRRLARLRGRPDPGPADVAKLLPVAYVVAGLLVVMGAIVIFADIVKPITLG